ncbi:alanine--tRNA ligase [Candidatus Bipolaricaulota bacterium]|nr:alanine--tRNA ligase [Candidatus Bipolaricaulota bacterium]
MNSRELREAYLSFFERNGHKRLPSASLIPEDPTLLFTSAGMVQFKDIFWGKVPPKYPRVTTCQKCFRTTDIERVGTTAYHHTFFEMLGNFSFGDYFKEGAIKLAWGFLTEVLELPKERLWVSVYEEDDEAYAIWRDVIGIPPERIVRLGKEHNWWGPVGGKGPCGPDTEIFWDWGEEHACGPHCQGPACDCQRFSEIWNLVFMQYDAQPDGTLKELARKNIDTGMGLERTTAVLEGVMSDFDTDLFRPVCQEIEALVTRDALRVTGYENLRNLIADHIRALVFLIADGVLPGNEKQGYVLRRVLRRAVRAADRLELPEGILVRLVEPVVTTLGDIYPEIVERRKLVEQVLTKEERSFRRTLRAGENRLRELLSGLPPGDTLPGEAAFELYDTYGFPLELTEEIAAEAGVQVDREGFERAMERQRARSRSVATYEGGATSAEVVATRTTPFLGYETLEAEAELLAVLDTAGTELPVVREGEARFVFSATPFYAEAGGQIADTGWVENLSRPGKAKVTDVQKSPQGTLHFVRVLEGEFRPGDKCRLAVDEPRRRGIERAHTATHLLHAALRKTLGEHVIQAGSWVGPEELRFDFTHFAALSEEELSRVEREAFQPVLSDIALKVQEMFLEEAKAYGAIAHFEEEYRGKEKVRVVEVPGVSAELCGGTHVRCTGEIGPIVILSEEAVAAGTRRIRALVGEKARAYLAGIRDERRALARLLKVPEGELAQAVEKLSAEVSSLRKELSSLEEKLASLQALELVSRAEEVGGVKLLGTVVEGGPEAAKQLVDRLAERLGQCAVILGTQAGERGIVVVKVTTERLHAGELGRVAAQALGGKGGGRPTFAQGGGPNAAALPQAVQEAIEAAREKLLDA